MVTGFGFMFSHLARDLGCLSELGMVGVEKWGWGPMAEEQAMFRLRPPARKPTEFEASLVAEATPSPSLKKDKVKNTKSPSGNAPMISLRAKGQVGETINTPRNGI